MGMVNKKGVVRIIEAVIAVLLVVGAFFIISAQRPGAAEQNLGVLLSPILEEMARDQSLREKIVNVDATTMEATIQDLENFIGSRLSSNNLDFEVKICELGEVCTLDSAVGSGEEVYSSERLVSSSINCGDCNPKRIKTAIWRK